MCIPSLTGNLASQSWYPVILLHVLKKGGWQKLLMVFFYFFFINPSLVLLRGVRSPTSVVLQLSFSVVIALLQFDFSLATVFLLQDSSKREVRRFDKREVRHPVLLFHVLKEGVGDRNCLWCFFFTNPSRSSGCQKSYLCCVAAWLQCGNSLVAVWLLSCNRLAVSRQTGSVWKLSTWE